MHIITILQWQLTYRITKEKFHGTICQNSDRFKVLCPFDSQVSFPLSFFQLKITNFTIGMKKKIKDCRNNYRPLPGTFSYVRQIAPCDPSALKAN